MGEKQQEGSECQFLFFKPGAGRDTGLSCPEVRRMFKDRNNRMRPKAREGGRLELEKVWETRGQGSDKHEGLQSQITHLLLPPGNRRHFPYSGKIPILFPH